MDRSPVLLVAVVALHLADSWLLCRRWLRPGDDRWWGVVLATLGQWGTLATVLSLAHALTPGGWLVGLAAITAVAIRVSRGGDGGRGGIGASPRHLSVIACAGWGIVAAVVSAALVLQWRVPLHKGDDLMYHASRAAYWLQNRSLLPFPTHNDRQNVFPVAADLPFLLGLLFTRDERIARVLHLAALPIALWGIARLERALGVRGPARVVGPLLFVTTPLVLISAEGIGAELWTAVALLGFASGLVSVLRGREGPGRLGWFGLGAFAALGVAMKLTLVPVVVLAPLALLARRSASSSLRVPALRLAAGLVIGTLASGLALTLVANTAWYHHPLGPAAMRMVHRSDGGLHSLRVHAARVPFLLFGVPVVPGEAARASIERGAALAAERLGATSPLRWERRSGWPGAFAVQMPRRDRRFSLTAVFVLAAAGWIGARAWRRHRRGRPVWRWPPLAIATSIAVVFLGVVLPLRWQAGAGLPDRFLGPLLAPGAALVALLFCRGTRHRGVAGVLLVLLAWSLVPGPCDLGERLAAALGEPARAPGRVGLFADAAAALPAGARVLLVANQNSGDYVLFAPERALSNVVLPWGQRPFDEAALAERIARDRPTHVLIEDRDHVDFHWGGTLSTREMVEAVAGRPGSRRVPLPDPTMRLFALDGANDPVPAP